MQLKLLIVAMKIQLFGGLICPQKKNRRKVSKKYLCLHLNLKFSATEWVFTELILGKRIVQPIGLKFFLKLFLTDGSFSIHTQKSL